MSERNNSEGGNHMSGNFNKELFMELANLIKKDMLIYVNTVDEMKQFANEYPKKYQFLLKDVQANEYRS